MREFTLMCRNRGGLPIGLISPHSDGPRASAIRPTASSSFLFDMYRFSFVLSTGGIRLLYEKFSDKPRVNSL